MTMKLTKMIPARRKTVTARWCKLEWKPKGDIPEHPDGWWDHLRHCYWCRHEYADGEMMAMAEFERIGNKTLCHSCATELLDSEKSE